MMNSAGHAANPALRAERRKGRRDSGNRPPWPGPRGRLRWSAATRNPRLAGQLVVIAFWIGIFVGDSLARPRDLGGLIPGRTHGHGGTEEAPRRAEDKPGIVVGERLEGTSGAVTHCLRGLAPSGLRHDLAKDVDLDHGGVRVSAHPSLPETGLLPAILGETR